jgi:hypothetical protein
MSDIFGYVKRNARKWSVGQIRKVLNEINSTKLFLERLLKEMERVA